MSLFESKPRWAGAPPVCIATNRMAFKDRAEMDAYRASIGMSAWAPKRVGVCKICGHWHYVGASPDPSGDSSGTGRSKKG